MAATDSPSGPDAPAGGLDLLTREETGIDKGWTTLLWNDDINLFNVVVDMLVKILEISEDAAREHAQTANDEGKAAVFNGGKDKALLIAEQLGSVGLWATVERA